MDMDLEITPENKKKIILGLAIVAFAAALALIIFMPPSDMGSQTGKAGEVFQQAEKLTCPEDCSDNNECTIDYCNAETDLKCKHVPIVSVECGTMCPSSCDDNLDYTEDYCSAQTDYKCEYKDIRECIGGFC